MKIQKGDRVKVLTGKERGKEGEVTRVMPDSGRILVDGVNIAKRHSKPQRVKGSSQGTMTPGGVIDKHMPIDVSNVAVVCPHCGPTRINSRVDADGLKVRTCVKCGLDL